MRETREASREVCEGSSSFGIPMAYQPGAIRDDGRCEVSGSWPPPAQRLDAGDPPLPRRALCNLSAGAGGALHQGREQRAGVLWGMWGALACGWSSSVADLAVENARDGSG